VIRQCSPSIQSLSRCPPSLHKCHARFSRCSERHPPSFSSFSLSPLASFVFLEAPIRISTFCSTELPEIVCARPQPTHFRLHFRLRDRLARTGRSCIPCRFTRSFIGCTSKRPFLYHSGSSIAVENSSPRFYQKDWRTSGRAVSIPRGLRARRRMPLTNPDAFALRQSHDPRMDEE